MSIEERIRYGKVTVMRHSDINKCPFRIMVPEHYKDGKCRCDDITHTAMARWGYAWDTMERRWVSEVRRVRS